MVKSTSAYFDTNKLYLVKPSGIILNKEKRIILEQDINNVDIAFVDQKGIYGLINKKVYDPFNIDNINNKGLYVGVFENDAELLVEYLFKNAYGIEPTTQITKGLFKNKPYYEIDELKHLYEKLIRMMIEIDDTKKVKKLSKF